DPKVTRTSLVLGSVDGFAEYLHETGDDPAEESVRLAYAARARRQGRVIGWPPGRNQPCWCGSERKYKKCCGGPARSPAGAR
ncbi:MAG: SEC-C domain-containing protein, partial [Actinobacteria bacterium]|nr:SEC-C domain-containing protein [Actinomycetota bacterium]